MSDKIPIEECISIEDLNDAVRDDVDDLIKQIAALTADNERLKCCGNCCKIYRYDCPLPTDEGKKPFKYDNKPERYCKDWQSYNITRGGIR